MLIKLILHKAFAFLSRYYTQKFIICKNKLDLKNRKYKYFHVLNNGIHSKTILDFINRNFNTEEHCFLIPLLKGEHSSLLELPNVYKYSLISIPVEQAEKIIFHGLFTSSFIDFLYRYPAYLKKSYWFIWGGDLYTEDDKISRYVKSNIQGILTAFDYEVYQEKFGNKKCFDVTYPHNMSAELPADKAEKTETVSILINNCADETTLEMLDILSKFKDENIRVCTVLSYVAANQTDCRLEIMQKGYEIFKEKFHPIISYMPADDYANFLSTIDIYISNQNRQQGNGNATHLCVQGKKVYVKSDTSVYKRYQKEGIVYFDTYTIKNLSFAEFVEYDEETKKQSVAILKERMADETKVKQWQEFFESPAVQSKK